MWSKPRHAHSPYRFLQERNSQLGHYAARPSPTQQMLNTDPSGRPTGAVRLDPLIHRYCSRWCSSWRDETRVRWPTGLASRETPHLPPTADHHSTVTSPKHCCGEIHSTRLSHTSLVIQPPGMLFGLQQCVGYCFGAYLCTKRSSTTKAKHQHRRHEGSERHLPSHFCTPANA